jgi:hypothetical protein
MTSQKFINSFREEFYRRLERKNFLDVGHFNTVREVKIMFEQACISALLDSEVNDFIEKLNEHFKNRKGDAK